MCVCIRERDFRSCKGSSVLCMVKSTVGTVNILLTQVLVRKCHFASDYSTSNICDDGKIQAKNKEAFKSCRLRVSQLGWWWGGEGLLLSVSFKVFLIRSLDEATV